MWKKPRETGASFTTTLPREIRAKTLDGAGRASHIKGANCRRGGGPMGAKRVLVIDDSEDIRDMDLGAPVTSDGIFAIRGAIEPRRCAIGELGPQRLAIFKRSREGARGSEQIDKAAQALSALTPLQGMASVAVELLGRGRRRADAVSPRRPPARSHERASPHRAASRGCCGDRGRRTVVFDLAVADASAEPVNVTQPVGMVVVAPTALAGNGLAVVNDAGQLFLFDFSAPSATPVAPLGTFDGLRPIVGSPIALSEGLVLVASEDRLRVFDANAMKRGPVHQIGGLGRIATRPKVLRDNTIVVTAEPNGTFVLSGAVPQAR